MPPLDSEFEFDCPCCGSALVVDAHLRRLVAHRPPASGEKPSLDDAEDILAAAAARRDAMFRQSVADERGRGDALSKRFDAALKQARGEPVTRPVRDFDLD